MGRESEAEGTPPKSRRRPGKATIKRSKRETETAPLSFGDELWNDFLTFRVAVLGPALLILFGVMLAISEANSNLQRVGGVAIAALAVLVIASYFFRFSTTLEGDRWHQSRTRRAARSILRNSWRIYLTIAGIIAALIIVSGPFRR